MIKLKQKFLVDAARLVFRAVVSSCCSSSEALADKYSTGDRTTEEQQPAGHGWNDRYAHDGLRRSPKRGGVTGVQGLYR
jgi:hypothetical protein